MHITGETKYNVADVINVIKVLKREFSECLVDEDSFLQKTETINVYKKNIGFGERRRFYGLEFVIYPGDNLVIFNSENKSQIMRDKVSKLGYNIASIEIVKKEVFGDIQEELNKIYWSELKKRNPELIEKNIAKLLDNVTAKIPETNLFEFVIYDPFVLWHGNSESTWPEYIPYDYTFTLEKGSNGKLDYKKLTEIVQKLPVHKTIAISSRIPHTETHLPLIDFNESANDVDAVKTVLKRNGIKTPQIASSGNSFHHYDIANISSTEEYFRILNLLSDQEEIGRYWPIHQIKQGFSLLRIAPSSIKPFFPEIVNPNMTYDRNLDKMVETELINEVK
ncbi:MAG: hypothetical protein ACP5NV_01230 [Candidatus Woesearchaeota archaeon]